MCTTTPQKAAETFYRDTLGKNVERIVFVSMLALVTMLSGLVDFHLEAQVQLKVVITRLVSFTYRKVFYTTVTLSDGQLLRNSR